MSVSVCLSVCVCICLSAIIFAEQHVRSSPNFFAHVIYGRGSVLLWRRRDKLSISGLWMTSYLLISRGCFRRRRPAEAQYTRSLGHGYKLCAVIPITGQRTHWTTFRALKVTFQVAAPGAESAVYDCLV